MDMREGNLSPSVLAKTQVLCFSLSIRYVARLAGACPISYPYSFEAWPFIILQSCTTKAKLARACPGFRPINAYTAYLVHLYPFYLLAKSAKHGLLLFPPLRIQVITDFRKLIQAKGLSSYIFRIGQGGKDAFNHFLI